MKPEWNILGMIKYGLSESIIFIGISPSAKKSFKNSTLTTLKKWCENAGILHYDFHNVIPHKEKSCDESDVDVDLLLEKTKDRKIIVALGGFVHKVLRKHNITHIKVDHPSPRNRALNDPHRHRQNIEILKQAYDRNY